MMQIFRDEPNEEEPKYRLFWTDFDEPFQCMRLKSVFILIFLIIYLFIVSEDIASATLKKKEVTAC